MNERVLDYGRVSRQKCGWARQLLSLLLGLAAVPGVLVAAWAVHKLRFRWLTDPTYLWGKTVSQIVARLGTPDEDLRDTDGALFAAAKQPIHLNHTYGPNEHFNGDFVYLDWFGGDFCRIDIRDGVATQVLHLPDMK